MLIRIKRLIHLVMLSPSPVRRSLKEPSIVLARLSLLKFYGAATSILGLSETSERGKGWIYGKLH